MLIFVNNVFVHYLSFIVQLKELKDTFRTQITMKKLVVC